MDWVKFPWFHFVAASFLWLLRFDDSLPFLPFKKVINGTFQMENYNCVCNRDGCWGAIGRK